MESKAMTTWYEEQIAAEYEDYLKRQTEFMLSCCAGVIPSVNDQAVKLDNKMNEKLDRMLVMPITYQDCYVKSPHIHKTDNYMEEFKKLFKSSKTAKELAVNFVKKDFDKDIMSKKSELMELEAELKFYQGLNVIQAKEEMLKQNKAEKHRCYKANKAIDEDITKIELFKEGLRNINIPVYEENSEIKMQVLCENISRLELELLRSKCFPIIRENEIAFLSDMISCKTYHIEEKKNEINRLEEFALRNNHVVEIIKKSF